MRKPVDAVRGNDADASGQRPCASRAIVAQIRPYDEADFPAVDAIALAAFPAGGFSASEELSRPWARLWVARAPEDGEIAGFMVSWHVADELHILNIATAIAMRRRGIATTLMHEALAYAAENRVRIIVLEVRRSNRPAILLYRALGFSAMGVRPGYYADNEEDAIEMLLALDPATGLALPGRDEIHVDV
jgi:[ribosomal protein S18]-alanine N-acetyltransferase